MLCIYLFGFKESLCTGYTIRKRVWYKSTFCSSRPPRKRRKSGITPTTSPRPIPTASASPPNQPRTPPQKHYASPQPCAQTPSPSSPETPPERPSASWPHPQRPRTPSCPDTGPSCADTCPLPRAKRRRPRIRPPSSGGAERRGCPWRGGSLLRGRAPGKVTRGRSLQHRSEPLRKRSCPNTSAQGNRIPCAWPTVRTAQRQRGWRI